MLFFLIEFKNNSLALWLAIGLTFENPDLCLRKYEDPESFDYPFHVKGVADDEICLCLSDVFHNLFRSRLTQFGCVLKRVTGFYPPTTVTLGGHVIHHEVLVGKDTFIEFPHFLRGRLYPDGLNSVGAISNSKPSVDYSSKSTVSPVVLKGDVCLQYAC